VWQRIESQEVPLGRVLIEHDVLREVQLCELWQIHAGPSLASLLRIKTGDTVYGRTALIFCDGEPAIELLEIVTPARV
jgi:chorismate-pyruvate lyase